MSTASSTASSSSKSIRLSVWAPSSASPSCHLPTLDPEGLYGASILQARRGAKNALGEVSIAIQAPSAWLHDAVPCLEDAETGVELARGVEAIDMYAIKLAQHKRQNDLLERSTNVSQDNNLSAWAKELTLRHYIEANLLPLVYQVLFAKEMYTTHTARIYASNLGIAARRSLPSRLRSTLQMRYAAVGEALNPVNPLSGILRQSNTQQEIEAERLNEQEELIRRAGLTASTRRSPNGLMPDEKEQTSQKFVDARLIAFAEQVCRILSDQLGQNEYFSGTAKPSLVDLRIFSLLAPLIMPPAHAYPALAASPVVKVIRGSFPALNEHILRIRRLLWPIKETMDFQGHSIIATPDWPSLPGQAQLLAQQRRSQYNTEPWSIRTATQLGRMTSQAYLFVRRATTRLLLQTSASGRHAEGVGAPSPSGGANAGQRQMTETERREARTLQIGRYAWYTSAVLGLIGTAFASGLLAIEIVDKEDVDGIVSEQASAAAKVFEKSRSQANVSEDEEVDVIIVEEDKGEEEGVEGELSEDESDAFETQLDEDEDEEDEELDDEAEE